MKGWKVALIIVGSIILLMGLSLGFGYFHVFATKTVGKAQQNANREVFEQTQSYVEGKRQIAWKLYNEYTQADSATRLVIKAQVAQTFADFDEQKNLTGPVRTFVYDCKYKH